MKKATTTETKKEWHKKPSFGSLYTMTGSKFIYISMNYYKQRLRFPTDRVDSPENWEELSKFLAKVGEKIRNRTFRFAKSFYWLDSETKKHFSMLEGNDYKPEPEHVSFGEYARDWMANKISSFSSVTKREYYSKALNSRIVPYFDKKSFASITSEEIKLFIDNLKRKTGNLTYRSRGSKTLSALWPRYGRLLATITIGRSVIHSPVFRQNMVNSRIGQCRKRNTLQC